MDRPGEKLRRVRERLKLTYRDVAQASQEIVARRGDANFRVSLSRLADIENRGRVPSIFRLYTLSAIYHLDLHEVMRWYGVPVEQLAADGARVKVAATHRIEVTPLAQMPALPAGGTAIDVRKTTFLRQGMQQPASFLLGLLDGSNHRQHCYGLVGMEDWSMFPILRPGSLVLIDENRRSITRSGWRNEFDRPIYFLEHRHGYLCGWCALDGGTLAVQPHPASEKAPTLFEYPQEIDVIGQVVGIAMLLDPQSRNGARTPPPPRRGGSPA
jgi:transcriptional regulator with XRE-family HTH domain